MNRNDQIYNSKTHFAKKNQPKCSFSLIPGLNSDIIYSLVDSVDGFFSIDEHTGVVSLERPLDREVQSTYELKARASDQGSPRLSSLCQVVISVLDINDNPPVFEHREYTATVSEDVAAGTQVLRVQAASRDTEANGEISYSIISGNEHGMFSVDPRTGMSEHDRVDDFSFIYFFKLAFAALSSVTKRVALLPIYSYLVL